MDDWKTIAIGLLGVTSAMLGWWARMLWDAVQNLKNDLGALQLHIATDYVKKDDLKERLSEVMVPVREALEEIKDWIKTQRVGRNHEDR